MDAAYAVQLIWNVDKKGKCGAWSNEIGSVSVSHRRDLTISSSTKKLLRNQSIYLQEDLIDEKGFF